MRAVCLPGGQVLHASRRCVRVGRRGARLAVHAASARFSVRKHVSFGECIRVVGSTPELGGWDVARAPSLRWGEGDVWSGEVSLTPGAQASFKFVVCRDGDGHAPEWEEGADRQLRVSDDGATVIAVFGELAPPKHSSSSRKSDKRSGGGGNDGAFSASPSDELVLALAGEEGRWQGREVTFMRSNEHSGQRRGTWKPEGLAGAAKALVEGDMCVRWGAAAARQAACGRRRTFRACSAAVAPAFCAC